MGNALQGKRIVIAGSQKTKEMSSIIESHGGTALVRSLQGITLIDDTVMEGALHRFVQHGADWVVFTTGIGAEALFDAASKLGILAEFVHTLSTAKVAARGYKTHGFLRKAGVVPVISDEDGTIGSLVDMLEPIDLHGQRVMIQLHGEDSPELDALMQKKEANEVQIVLPYRHTAPDTSTVSLLLEELRQGDVDAVCFTTRVQVRNLFNYARETGTINQLKDSFESNALAGAVGKVTAQALRDEGVTRIIAPEMERMGALIIEIAHAMGRRLTMNHNKTEIQTDITEPVRKQLDAYNKRDIDAFIECYADNCVVEDSAGNITLEGALSMRSHYQKLFDLSPELNCKLVTRIARGRHVIDEEELTGWRGNPNTRYAVAVYQVENGKIIRVRFLD